MLNLYKFSLKVLEELKNDEDNDNPKNIDNLEDLLANYKALSDELLHNLDTSIRSKITKKGLGIIQNIYTGFDTEYQVGDLKKLNKLLSIQLSVSTKTSIKLPKNTPYDFLALGVLSGEDLKSMVIKTKYLS